MHTEQQYTILALILAIVIIGGAYIYTNKALYAQLSVNTKPEKGLYERDQVTPEREQALVDPRRSEQRWVQGGTDPEVTIVEFSDYECPFCSRLHPTLKQLVEEFDGAVAWEYRHLPLVSHPNAREAALAAECVGELAGNDAFWEFTDYLFANQRSLSPRTYEAGASAVGILPEALNECTERPDIAERVLEDERTATILGAGGTPYSVILYADGSTRGVPGALPYNQFKALIKR